LREGRKIQLSAVRLLADGVVVVAATVLRIKMQTLALPPETAGQRIELPGPDQSIVEPAKFAGSPFTRCISMRAARGRFGMAGPAAIWFRVDQPLVAGSAVSQACGPWSRPISVTARRRRSTFGSGPSSMPI
jgi:hypothetical protein